MTATEIDRICRELESDGWRLINSVMQIVGYLVTGMVLLVIAACLWELLCSPPWGRDSREMRRKHDERMAVIHDTQRKRNINQMEHDLGLPLTEWEDQLRPLDPSLPYDEWKAALLQRSRENDRKLDELRKRYLREQRAKNKKRSGASAWWRGR
jgi:hypothetical protein